MKTIRGADPRDICKCGDYRRDHDDGIGHCRMPNDYLHGWVPCLKFRLSSRAPGNAVSVRTARAICLEVLG